MALKIGEVARRAGLSVRALRHYDGIGLLSPSARTDGGLRLYGPQDLVRLQRIQALKQLGYGLASIREALDGIHSPRQVLQHQIDALERQARSALELRGRLRQLAQRLDTGDATSPGDWLQALEMVAVYQRHLGPLETRRMMDASGAGERELVGLVRAAMEKGLQPHARQAQALAWRWMRMVITRTGNSARLAAKVFALQESDACAQRIVGIDRSMLDWIGAAIAHARASLFARHLDPSQAAQVLRRQLATLSHMRAWPELLAQLRDRMDAGDAPGAPAVQALAAHWQQLFRESHCGDDAALEVAVRRALDREPDLMLGVGVEPALLRYARLAIRDLGKEDR